MRFIIALLASILVAAADDVSKSLPADTTLVARVDLQAVRNSIIMTQIIDRNFERYSAMLEGVESTTGIRLDDVKTVWLLAVKKNDGAIVLDGAIDPEVVRTRANQAAAKHDHVTIGARDDFPLLVTYKQGKETMGLAVKNGRAIMGNNSYVSAMLDALVQGTKVTDEDGLLDKLRQAKTPVAIAMLAMNDEIAKRNRQLATMVQSGFATVDLSDTVTAQVELETANADQADGLHMISQGMIALQAAQLQQMQNNPEQFPAQRIRQATVMTELLKTAKVSREDATVMMAWTMSDAAQKLIAETVETNKTNDAAPANNLAVP